MITTTVFTQACCSECGNVWRVKGDQKVKMCPACLTGATDNYSNNYGKGAER